MERLFAAWLTLVLVFGLAVELQAGISSSAHDFSNYSWNSTGQICGVCHTPHNAMSVTLAPLWNHEMPTGTYTLYDSSTLDAAMEQPGGISKLCLSCHDGTVAMDSFGGNTGNDYMTGAKAVGRGLDLSDDHPVGFRWEHQTVETCGTYCHFGAGGDPYSYEVRFYNHRVECSTCHDPHNNGPQDNKMLRVTMVASELCVICHNGK